MMGAAPAEESENDSMSLSSSESSESVSREGTRETHPIASSLACTQDCFGEPAEVAAGVQEVFQGGVEDVAEAVGQRRDRQPAGGSRQSAGRVGGSPGEEVVVAPLNRGMRKDVAVGPFSDGRCSDDPDAVDGAGPQASGARDAGGIAVVANWKKTLQFVGAVALVAFGGVLLWSWLRDAGSHFDGSADMVQLKFSAHHHGDGDRIFNSNRERGYHFRPHDQSGGVFRSFDLWDLGRGHHIPQGKSADFGAALDRAMLHVRELEGVDVHKPKFGSGLFIVREGKWAAWPSSARDTKWEGHVEWAHEKLDPKKKRDTPLRTMVSYTRFAWNGLMRYWASWKKNRSARCKVGVMVATNSGRPGGALTKGRDFKNLDDEYLGVPFRGGQEEYVVSSMILTDYALHRTQSASLPAAASPKRAKPPPGGCLSGFDLFNFARFGTICSWRQATEPRPATEPRSLEAFREHAKSTWKTKMLTSHGALPWGLAYAETYYPYDKSAGVRHNEHFDADNEPAASYATIQQVNYPAIKDNDETKFGEHFGDCWVVEGVPLSTCATYNQLKQLWSVEQTADEAARRFGSAEDVTKDNEFAFSAVTPRDAASLYFVGAPNAAGGRVDFGGKPDTNGAMFRTRATLLLELQEKGEHDKAIGLHLAGIKAALEAAMDAMILDGVTVMVPTGVGMGIYAGKLNKQDIQRRFNEVFLELLNSPPSEPIQQLIMQADRVRDWQKLKRWHFFDEILWP